MLPSGPAASARGPLNGVGIVELGDDAGRRDAADLARGEHAEPNVAVGAERDRARLAVGRRNRELRDLAARRDARHLAREMLREPHVAVGAERDDARRALLRRNVELDETGAVGIHAADAIAVALREPHRAVGRERDRRRAARGMRQRELRDLAGRRQGARSGPSQRCCAEAQPATTNVATMKSSPRMRTPSGDA